MTTVSEEKLLKVSATTNIKDLGAAIANAIYAGDEVALRAIGAGAVNQTIKGAILAGGLTAQRGIILSLRPGFQTIESREGSISAVYIKVLVD